MKREPSGSLFFGPLALAVGAGWALLPWDRYEHIHVRFSPAIHGLRNFLESHPHAGAPAINWRRLPILEGVFA